MQEQKTVLTNRRPSLRPTGRRGFALMLTGLMLVFIVSLMGIAVDAGVLFAIRCRLNTSLNEAVVTAARGVNGSNNHAEACTRATEAARQSLRETFPDTYYGIEAAKTKLTAALSRQMQAGQATGLLQVALRAEVAAPVYFMKFLGVPTVPVSVEATALRRNLVTVMVLDRSSSMGRRITPAGTLPAALRGGATPCERAVFAASKTAGYMSPYDHLGLVSFAQTARKDFPASNEFQRGGPGSLADGISRLDCAGGDNPAAALEAAYQEIQRINQAQALNVIVVFTSSPSRRAELEAAAEALGIRQDLRYKVRIESIALQENGADPKCTPHRTVALNQANQPEGLSELDRIFTDIATPLVEMPQ